MSHAAEPAAAALARTALARAAMANGMDALASGDKINAIAWLERAHRLVPQDANATLSLASALLDTETGRAAGLFRRIAERYDIRQAWLGLAAAHILLGQRPRESLSAILSRHALTPDAESLAERYGGNWCGLRACGTIVAQGNGRVAISLDGRTIKGSVLPPGWETARIAEVSAGGRPLLGSPIQVAAIRRLAGCAEAHGGGIRGWVWYPNDPDTAPVLTISRPDAGWERVFVAGDENAMVPDTGPLARPRRFQLDAATLPGTGPVHIRGPDGRDLTGSPLDPVAERAAHASAPLWIPGTPEPSRLIGVAKRKRGVTVVVPVHDGGPPVMACLDSVLESLPGDARLLIVDDGSRDPAVIAKLDGMARLPHVKLLRNKRALGFPGAANTGMRAAKSRDVVLLNSDTLVPPGWLDRLRAAAYSAADIGTVTPFSNDASLVSYPGPAGTNPRPDQAATNRLDRLARKANGGVVIDIPAGVGFCLYIRRDCLDAAGLFRDGLFAQGYGEENDFCLRARRLGWRNVALPGLFVAHIGQVSFGAAAIHLRARNARLLEQMHPGYDKLVADFFAVDPLSGARRAIDLAVWRERARRWTGSAILITHADGGGVERRLARTVAAHEAAGRRAIVLRPATTPSGTSAIAVRDGVKEDVPNLVYAMPAELPALLRLLRAARAETIEAHHLAGYDSGIYRLIAALGVPYDVHVHDYALVCPRISLVAGQNHYCGEPDLHDCEACVAEHGSYLKENIGPGALRERSGRFLKAARNVVVPSEDTRRRLRRYFDGFEPVMKPHMAPVFGTQASVRQAGNRVCVAGAIGVHKGYHVLLACARDAAQRGLDLKFVVAGHTIDDTPLLETGAVFITGEYNPAEAVDLIVRQDAAIGFVPSIVPETFCLALSELWQAGLHAIAFDIGAPAERIRAAGRGIVLPLGLSPAAINNSILAAIRTTRH